VPVRSAYERQQAICDRLGCCAAAQSAPPAQRCTRAVARTTHNQRECACTLALSIDACLSYRCCQWECHIFQVVLGLHATGILSSKSSDYVRSFETIDEALEWSIVSDPCLAVPRICTQCHVCLASSITAMSRRARKIPHSMAAYRSTHALTHSLTRWA
jgi:hypothetical protein